VDPVIRRCGKPAWKRERGFPHLPKVSCPSLAGGGLQKQWLWVGEWLVWVAVLSLALMGSVRG